jgi:hypothetical protein
VFTARYAKSPYIKETGVVFKGLNNACANELREKEQKNKQQEIN